MAGVTRSPGRPLATRVPKTGSRRQGRRLTSPAPARPVKRKLRGRRK